MSYSQKIYEYVSTPKKKLIFGEGSTNRVGVEVKEFGNKVLLVTDKGVEKAGLVDRIIKPLKSERLDVNVFNEIKYEPDIQTAELVASAVRGRKHDVVIGLGGGSSLDTAKMASVFATNLGKIEQYLGANLVKKAGLPKILIPTTAGTGSEVSPGAAVTDPGTKKFISSPYLFSDVAIVDPLMSMTMPPRITAITGFDALSHAIETMLSIKSNVITDTLALGALKLIANNLRAAYHDGKNIEARHNMALAATMSGIAMTNSSVVIGHAIAHVLDSKCNVRHGLACALALPYVMEHNLPVSTSKLVSIASAMNEEVSGLTMLEAASRALNAVTKLMEDVDIPTNLRELDVPRDALPNLAEVFITDPWYDRFITTNPREVTREDAAKIFTKMWEGKLMKT